MSDWQVRQVTVTLAADLHCGDRPLGFVARTHPCVPAHIPWYALVPALVEALQLPDRFESYQRVEKFFDKTLRFTPFFPLDKGGNPLFPWREIDRERLEAELIGAQYGVALSYAERGARDNHLFETEVLLSVGRQGVPTRLQGALFWKPWRDDENRLRMEENGAVNGLPLARLLESSQWGGQRNKGMGRLREVKLAAAPKTSPFYDQAAWGEEEPVLEFSGNREGIPFYLRYDPAHERQIRGRLMPLVGRRFAEGKGHGLKAEPQVAVWDLGWRPADPQQKIRVRLADRRTVRLWRQAE